MGFEVRLQPEVSAEPITRVHAALANWSPDGPVDTVLGPPGWRHVVELGHLDGSPEPGRTRILHLFRGEGVWIVVLVVTRNTVTPGSKQRATFVEVDETSVVTFGTSFTTRSLGDLREKLLTFGPHAKVPERADEFAAKVTSVIARALPEGEGLLFALAGDPDAPLPPVCYQPWFGA